MHASAAYVGRFNPQAGESLLAAGSIIDETWMQGITPLLFDLAYGEKGAYRWLIAKGADIHHADYAGDCPANYLDATGTYRPRLLPS